MKHVATSLTPEDQLKFGVIAARQGLSKSALLRKLALEVIKNHESKNEGVAA